VFFRKTNVALAASAILCVGLLSACTGGTGGSESPSPTGSSTGSVSPSPSPTEIAPPDITRIIFPNDKQPVVIPPGVPSPVLPKDFDFAKKAWKISVEPANAAELINPNVPAGGGKEGFLVPNIVPTGEVDEFTVIIEQKGKAPIKVKIQLAP